ncbi:MAG: hypothetical protein GXY96_02480 [Tissierellia bacterium]|nr:hypothetical protein [Tissierellia bacterium]
MRNYYYKYRSRWKKVVGIFIAVAGIIIVFSIAPMKLLLFLIGLAMIAIGVLLIKMR